MRSLVFRGYVEAPQEAAWEVVSDVAGFGDVAPNLSRAEVLEGTGEGMQRRCYDKGGRGWDEVCTLWEEGRRYEMRVRTETYPFPLRQMFRASAVTPRTKSESSTARMPARERLIEGSTRPCVWP